MMKYSCFRETHFCGGASNLVFCCAMYLAFLCKIRRFPLGLLPHPYKNRTSRFCGNLTRPGEIMWYRLTSISVTSDAFQCFCHLYICCNRVVLWSYPSISLDRYIDICLQIKKLAVCGAIFGTVPESELGVIKENACHHVICWETSLGCHSPFHHSTIKGSDPTVPS